ncbi:MAG: hypothetical protein KJ989_07300, partial [Gammaproteobacteria bacterium]|nr:hypothetical protein [Gammaproteobacteria bacterium]
ILKEVASDNAESTKQATDQIKGLWSGAYEGAGKSATDLKKELENANKGLGDSTKVTTDKMKASYKDLSKVAKEEISKITSAQREANAELEKLQKERLDIDERYNKLRATLSGATGGDPSYGQANALKVAARNALQNGDLENAKTQAQAAAKILEDLAKSGGNTYGLQGFADELQAIEAEANGIEQSRAAKTLADITAELNKLKALADVKITVDMTPEEIANAQAKMQELAAILSKSLVVTPTITLGDVSNQGADTFTGAQGFARGTNSAPPGMAWVGEQGPELLNFAGGEQVITAGASRALASRYASVTPEMAGAASSVAPSFPDLGRVAFEVGGEKFSLYASPGDALDLKRLAMKRGRTSQ